MTLPNSVTSVGNHCFKQCLKFKEVQLSESMTYIAEGLFADCRSLTQITLPEKIASVDEGAFANCIALKSIKSKALYPPEVIKDAVPATSYAIRVS